MSMPLDDHGNIVIDLRLQWTLAGKDSGFGREGPRLAIRELTEERLVIISL